MSDLGDSGWLSPLGWTGGHTANVILKRFKKEEGVKASDLGPYTETTSNSGWVHKAINCLSLVILYSLTE